MFLAQVFRPWPPQLLDALPPIFFCSYLLVLLACWIRRSLEEVPWSLLPPWLLAVLLVWVPVPRPLVVVCVGRVELTVAILVGAVVVAAAVVVAVVVVAAVL